jgi:hypothetical protein
MSPCFILSAQQPAGVCSDHLLVSINPFIFVVLFILLFLFLVIIASFLPHHGTAGPVSVSAAECSAHLFGW